MTKSTKKFQIFFLINLDIFFLPYFNIVVMPFSSFYIIYWMVKNYNNILKDEQFNEILLCVFIMFFSTCIGSIINSSQNVIVDNIKRFLQYVIAFGYYFYFKAFFKKNDVDLKRILWFFVLFVVVFGIVFQTNLGLFKSLTAIWNKGNTYNSSSLGKYDFEVYRYNFIWTDPNNIAYAITGIIMFMLCYCQTAFFEKVILFIANIYILLLSMSSGGWIAFVLSWGAYIVYSFLDLKTVKIKTTVGALIGGAGLLFLLFYLYINGAFADIITSNVVTNALDRFNNNENSRIEIWLKILKGDSPFKYIFLGQGSEIYINNRSIATHSGHLYWIYAYGFVSYIIFLKIYFFLGGKSLKKYIPIIAFFLCFTMNTMIGEQKLFIAFILIICYIKERGNEKCEKQLVS